MFAKVSFILQCAKRKRKGRKCKNRWSRIKDEIDNKYCRTFSSNFKTVTDIIYDLSVQHVINFCGLF